TYRFGMIIVQKDGFAISWDNWDMRNDKTSTLTLEKSYEFYGIVVDDANNPVKDAEIQIAMLIIGDIRNSNEGRYLMAAEQLDMFKTTTDANGFFVFKNIPAKARAEFTAQKAGRATVNTFIFDQMNYNPGQYTVESNDIKIIQPLEAKIHGRVLESGTAKPVGGVKLICVVEPRIGPSGAKPVVSKADGTFTFEGLDAKTYTLQAFPSQKETAQWVIEPLTVTTVAGQTISDTVINASKGGILEVAVHDIEKKNIAGVNVYVREKGSRQGQRGTTDSNGIATIRLLSGEYELQTAHKEGYSTSRDRQLVTVQDGKTTRMEIELKGSPKISGIVTDTKGKPLSNVSIKVFPSTALNDMVTDANGRYEVSWNSEPWMYNQQVRTVLIARNVERNLAMAMDVNENIQKLNIKMLPGIIITGKVVGDNNKPLADAQVRLNLRASNWSMDIDQKGVKTNVNGMYEYKALPHEQKYDMYALAEGYGQTNVEMYTDEAIDGRLEIDPLILKLATMSVSGIVKDSNDKPVKSADVAASGQGQQHRRAVSDANGRFTIDKLCEGQLHVYANYNKGRTHMYGYTNAEAGVNDVELIITPQGSSNDMYAEKQPSSLKGKPLPDMNNIGLKFDANDVKDKAILLCFADMNQRPSRHCFNELVKIYNDLNQKDVYLAVVQVGNADFEIKHSFPLGQIADNEKVRLGFGIKNLPWLLLSDAKHIVIEEGFSLTELAEQLKNIKTE
ncbi:MAG: carboxypeptidase regulatory-like domain-containing protein, partial [Phycisphaerales bacterium]